MIKYIGSKRALLDWILKVIKIIIKNDESLSKKQKNNIKILDPFSGSCRVSYALKKEGYYVIAGDYMYFSFLLAKALIETNKSDYPESKVLPILDYLNNLEPEDAGWFTKNYSLEAKFFQEHNAKKIETIRKKIEEYKYDENLYSILMTSLIIAADKVDSTTATQMAYLKKWAPRSYNNIILEYPPLLYGDGLAIHGDSLEWSPQYEVDVAYLDPPYNQHSYLSNYHVWETLALFDNPNVYGKVNKRQEAKMKKSLFNIKKMHKEALQKMIKELKSEYIVISFNNESYLSVQEITNICNIRNKPIVISHPHKRYIGAIIGIYNQKGEKVGKVKSTRNLEYLFIIPPNEEQYAKLKNELSCENQNVIYSHNINLF
ncbi:MAG: DNA adenine methylase [Candidatus Bilamarchaeaceae archaeon]